LSGPYISTDKDQEPACRHEAATSGLTFPKLSATKPMAQVTQELCEWNVP
jgi:hypothetical protein